MEWSTLRLWTTSEPLFVVNRILAAQSWAHSDYRMKCNRALDSPKRAGHGGRDGGARARACAGNMSQPGGNGCGGCSHRAFARSLLGYYGTICSLTGVSSTGRHLGDTVAEPRPTAQRINLVVYLDHEAV